MPKRKRATPNQAALTPADNFAARVLGLMAWARDRVQVVVAAAVVLVLLVAAGLYYVFQRSERLELAAAELETVQFAALTQAGPQAQDEIRAYIDRFSGTPYALEAYLLLGDLYLRQGQAESAISALQEVAPSDSSPLHVQATFLLASAFEEAERWDEAAETYQALLQDSDLAFQRREAGAGLARTELARGNPDAAIAAYEAVLAQMDELDPERGRFEMRMAEVRAQNP